MNKIKRWFLEVTNWHVNITATLKTRLNLTDYQIIWVWAYFEGILTVLILQWIF